MVILGREKKKREWMAMGPGETERSSKPLHNFNLPCLKWGNQRFLRCMKVAGSSSSGGGEVRNPGVVDRRSEVERALIGRRTESEFRRRESTDRRRDSDFFKAGKAAVDSDDGIDAVREKLMFDLQTAADKMKDAILREGMGREPPATATATSTSPAPAPAPNQAPSSSSPPEAVRPWNLRTRRAACKAPSGSGNGGCNGGGGGAKATNFQVDVVKKPNFLPLKTTEFTSKSPRFPAGAASSSAERAKFSVPLMRREIEEDFMAMGSQRLPRRPKKRPRIVQKQLDTLFPGLWLTEVTPDLYQVPDELDNVKR